MKKPKLHTLEKYKFKDPAEKEWFVREKKAYCYADTYGIVSTCEAMAEGKCICNNQKSNQ